MYKYNKCADKSIDQSGNEKSVPVFHENCHDTKLIAKCKQSPQNIGVGRVDIAIPFGNIKY